MYTNDIETHSALSAAPPGDTGLAFKEALMSNFSRTTIARLAKRGIRIVGMTVIPDANGSYANGDTGYNLDNQGQYQVKTFSEVLALAA